MPISELTQLGDKITEVAIPEVANVSIQLSSTELESLCAEIVSLKQQIISLKKASRHAHSPYRCGTTSPAPPTQSSDEIYWYHRTFGNSAKKCLTPCSYQGNDQASR